MNKLTKLNYIVTLSLCAVLIRKVFDRPVSYCLVAEDRGKGVQLLKIERAINKIPRFT